MSSKLLIFGALAVVGVVATWAAVGRSGGGRWHGGRGPGAMHGDCGGFGGGYGFGAGARLHEMIGDLGLSDAQKESVKSILRQSHGRIEPELEQAHQARGTLFDAAFSAAPDDEAVRAASESVARVTSDLTLEMGRTMAAIRATLTPEQRQKFDETLAERRQRREKRVEQFREHRDERFEEFLQSF